MLLSIIIVHYKNPELLKLCLKSIRKNLSIDNEKYEVLVVDSEAQPETEDLLAEEFGWVKYLPSEKNIGYAVGVNCGLKNSQGQYCLILNPDMVVTENSIPKMINYLEKNPEIGLMGPKLLNFNGQIQNSCFRFYRPMTVVYRRTLLGKTGFGKKSLASFNFAEKTREKNIFPDWLMGSALLTKKSALDKVGLMDERFFLYFEDVDWAKRFWENGYKVVYFPEAIMLHFHQRRSRAGLDVFDVFLRKEARWHIQSGIKYFLKHGLRYKSGLDYAKQLA